LPEEHYIAAYNVPNDWWKDVILTEGYKTPRTNIEDEYDLAQLHCDYSHSNPDLRK